MRAVWVGVLGLGLALFLLTAHIFIQNEWLQIAALWSLGAAFVALWVAVLLWRMPVLRQAVLTVFVIVWICGIGVAVCLVLAASTRSGASLLWQRSVQGLALGLSLAVGALLLRGLLHRRATLLIGRLLSLLSPLGILLLILLLPSAR